MQSFLGLYNKIQHCVPNVLRLAASLIKKLHNDESKSFPELTIKEKQSVHYLNKNVNNRRYSHSYGQRTTIPWIQTPATLNMDASYRNNNQTDLANRLVIDQELSKRVRKTGDNAQTVPFHSMGCATTPAYLEESFFTVRTNHKAITGLLTMFDTSRKFPRWLLRLSESLFNIGHCVGIRQQAVDALSRLLTVRSGKSKLDDDIPTLDINPKTFETAWNVRMK